MKRRFYYTLRKMEKKVYYPLNNMLQYNNINKSC